MKSFIAKFFAVLALVSAITAFTEHADAKPRRLKALVVSGQNNHNWPVSHKARGVGAEQPQLAREP